MSIICCIFAAAVDQLAAQPSEVQIDGRPETKLLDLNVRYNQLMQSDLRSKLNLQNRQVYNQLIESIKMMDQHRVSRDLAQENYRVALMNYEAGVGTMTDLLESEALLLQAENAYTDSRISYQSAARKFREFNR